ncbi:pyruvate kinase alpha/beta domain-containing protein, partial [Vibrio parahaemolyticus]|nr:pyruvate kinase alpha/beta domain-containing protein [Vibrio parahaemolyticus]
QATLNRCALLRGVIPFYFDTKQASGLEAAIAALDALKERNLLEEGDLVIITQGDIMGVEGSTNCMRILPVY